MCVGHVYLSICGRKELCMKGEGGDAACLLPLLLQSTGQARHIRSGEGGRSKQCAACVKTHKLKRDHNKKKRRNIMHTITCESTYLVMFWLCCGVGSSYVPRPMKRKDIATHHTWCQSGLEKS